MKAVISRELEEFDVSVIVVVSQGEVLRQPSSRKGIFHQRTSSTPHPTEREERENQSEEDVKILVI